MDIAEVSMSMSMQSLQQDISLSMMKKVMDREAVSAANMISEISECNPASAEPSFNKLDVRA